jgi:hypothetical protein
MGVLIKYPTAKAAKAAGFKPEHPSTDYVPGFIYDAEDIISLLVETEIQEEDYRRGDYFLRPTQSVLHKWVRDNRGVLIQVYNNASGYLWAMAKIPGGTDLGYSEYNGPNSSGCWDSYEEAFEDALQQVLKGTLDKFHDDTNKDKFHWGNFADYLRELK